MADKREHEFKGVHIYKIWGRHMLSLDFTLPIQSIPSLAGAWFQTKEWMDDSVLVDFQLFTAVCCQRICSIAALL